MGGRALCKNQFPLQLLQDIHPMHFLPIHSHPKRDLRIGILSLPQDTQHLLRALDIPDPKVILQFPQRVNDQITVLDDIALTARDEKRECERRVLAVVIEWEGLDARETAMDCG